MKYSLTNQAEDSDIGESPDTPYSFVTFFDIGYLSRGLALIESIRNHGDESKILVICIDNQTYSILSARANELNLECVTQEQLIHSFPELNQAKENRTAVEFYFTLTPFVLKFAFIGKEENHIVLYLDADLYFFESPSRVVDQLNGQSVAMIKHNYPWFLRSLEKKYGTYNVGLLAFKKDAQGIHVLQHWALQCLEWCHDYPEGGKYADQGYLENFFEISKSIQVLSHSGLNLAPWNSSSSKLEIQSGKVRVDKGDLIFFHFHGLKHAGKFWISTQLNYYSPMRRKVFLAIYGSYVQHLLSLENIYYSGLDHSNIVKRKTAGFRGLISSTARATFRGLSIVLGQAVGEKKAKERVS
jgi:hypothetical protein